jgi:hypothetical protein
MVCCRRCSTSRSSLVDFPAVCESVSDSEWHKNCTRSSEHFYCVSYADDRVLAKCAAWAYARVVVLRVQEECGRLLCTRCSAESRCIRGAQHASRRCQICESVSMAGNECEELQRLASHERRSNPLRCLNPLGVCGPASCARREGR